PPRRPLYSRPRNSGEVAEWLNAPVSKTGRPARVAGVRISPSPLLKTRSPRANNVRASHLEAGCSPVEVRTSIKFCDKPGRFLPSTVPVCGHDYDPRYPYSTAGDTETAISTRPVCRCEGFM